VEFQPLNSLPQYWFTPFSQLFIWLAAIGFLLSVWVHVGAIFGLIVAPLSFFWGLHVGIFVVFFPAILATKQIAGTYRRKDFWKVALRFAPPWMLYLLYGLFGYAFLNFFRGYLKIAVSGGHKNLNANDWCLFSGHWMLFYFGSLALLYSASHAGTATAYCTNGHRFSPQYSACPQCGEATRYFAGSN
jgi:hypothetical protein